MYCAFSGCEACHLGACCGPVCCTESMEERAARWDVEYDKAMAARTEKFLQRYPHQYDFSYGVDGSVCAARSSKAHGEEGKGKTVMAVPPYSDNDTAVPLGSDKLEGMVFKDADGKWPHDSPLLQEGEAWPTAVRAAEPEPSTSECNLKAGTADKPQEP